VEIIIIANNIEGDSDGIGKHARIVAEEMNTRDGINARIFTGTTTSFGVLKRVVSLEMHKAFRHAIDYIKNNKVNTVIVEYPFNEFNSIVIADYKMLKRVCSNTGTKLALSMHEYDRVKPLRKLVITSFLRESDLVFVSEPHYQETLKKYNKNIYLRTIPNHIPEVNGIEKDRNRFAFFGMVNKAKAFNEMIEAWKIFNVDNKYTLDIVTGTDIEIENSDQYGINLYIKEEDKRVAKILSRDAYAFCPIKPNVSFNNSSFVSGCQCGCVPIGVFNKELSNIDFAIRMNSYFVQDFIEAASESVLLSDNTYMEYSQNAREFGMRFTIKSTVDSMIARL